MNISVVTWTLGETDSKLVIDRAKALGLEGIQYAGDHRDVDPSDLKKTAEAAGIKIIAIDPFNAAPSDPMQATSAAAIAYYKQVVDFALEAGSVPVTLHGLSLWTRNCADRHQAAERLIECCLAVNAYALERNIQTLYEVCNHYEVPLIHTAAECRQLIEKAGGGNMRMILDSFHMNINEPNPLAALRESLADMAVYHISDSNRGAIGNGNIDFAAQFQVLSAGGFEGEVALELVLPHLTPSTAPATSGDNLLLDRQILSSAAQWRAYESRNRA